MFTGPWVDVWPKLQGTVQVLTSAISRERADLRRRGWGGGTPPPPLQGQTLGSLDPTPSSVPGLQTSGCPSPPSGGLPGPRECHHPVSRGPHLAPAPDGGSACAQGCVDTRAGVGPGESPHSPCRPRHGLWHLGKRRAFARLPLEPLQLSECTEAPGRPRPAHAGRSWLLSPQRLAIPRPTGRPRSVPC